MAGNGAIRALIETDQARIARAQSAIDDLQAIALFLCHKRWTVALAERFQGNLQDIEAGLSTVRRWMSAISDPLVGGSPSEQTGRD